MIIAFLRLDCISLAASYFIWFIASVGSKLAYTKVEGPPGQFTLEQNLETGKKVITFRLQLAFKAGC